MNKKQELQNALTDAMKARDEETKKTLRLVLASIKMAELESKGELDEPRILTILQKEVKTREDTIAESRRANREDLARDAEAEILILNRFLPQPMDADALQALINKAVAETGASSLKDMGAVMQYLKPEIAGRANGQEVSRIVREILQGS